ncbi:MAG: Arm DNA-binding domain-containing protein, partial [Bacteroides ovatus]|nr:Arm DNA-binding domain-containing protein [Bacteroides ovatus]
MATFKAVVFQTGRHIKLDGTSNIKIRIYHNRESQYISTAYYIRPENMDESGRILSGVTNGEMIEYEINAYIQKIRREYLKLGQDRTQFMSCMDLKEEIEKSLAPDAEFIDFVEFAQNIVIQTKKKKTAEWYSSSIDTLCWYTKRKKIDIKLITSFLLNKMIKDLYQSGPAGIPLEPGTISHYLRGLRALYNKAKLYYNNEDFDIIRIPGDPFKKAEIPEYRRKRKNIDINTLLRIRDFQSDKRRTNMARDVFMMMFYMMGVNINDLYSISCERRGRLEYTRSKTN